MDFRLDPTTVLETAKRIRPSLVVTDYIYRAFPHLPEGELALDAVEEGVADAARAGRGGGGARARGLSGSGPTER